MQVRRRKFFNPVAQGELDLIVIASEVEDQRVALARKHQPGVPAATTLKNTRLQSSDADATVQMRPAPTCGHGVHQGEDFIAIQLQGSAGVREIASRQHGVCPD
jgi:hypothetical protein